MLRLFTLLDSSIVVMMVPCGFIPVQLLTFCPDLGTPITLFKLLMEKKFRSLCYSPTDCLRWALVGWLVGSVRFAVSDLKFPQLEWSLVLIILIDCWCKWRNLLLFLLYFFCLHFSIVSPTPTVFSRFVQFYFSRLVQLFCSQL